MCEALVAATDVFVSASTKEPFGIALIERLVHGVPVVAASDAGPHGIVQPDATEPPAQPDTLLLAAATRQLLNDKLLRERMARATRRDALERSGAPAMTQAVERELRVAGNGSAP